MTTNQRTFTTTHPWISFSLDLNQVHYATWVMLGEAESKCAHIAGDPLLPETSKYLHQVYLAKGVNATTAIEGNTLTEEEVLKYLEGKLNLPPSKEYLGQEIDNIITACNYIGARVLAGDADTLKVQDLLHYNAIVLKKLPLEDYVSPGEIRKISVGVGRYRAAPAEDAEYLLQRLCDWLNHEFKIPRLNPTAIGILKAIVAHIYIAWIHPFGDGNGRTARLVEFQVLLSSGVPTAAAHLLSNHYNQTRTEYVRQLDRASKSGGNILPFIDYSLQGFIDGLREQIKLIQAQQMDVHWRYYVHERFKNLNKKVDRRRKHLLLDLSDVTQLPVPVAQVRRISPRVAEEYAKLDDRTIQRDLKALEEMNLIVRDAEGVDINESIILGLFTPRRLPST
jgi:Fic family protein